MAPVFFLATLFASLAASASAIANIRCTPVTGQKMDVSWTSDSSDSSPMSLALMSAAENSRNPGGLVLADNVSPHDQSITVHLPTVEPGAYIISLISTPKRARARAPGPILGSSSPFHILARQDSSSSSGSGSSSSSSTLPPLSKSSSKLSASLSAIESSISAAESSQLSSASSAFSAGASNISSAVSMRSSVSAAQSSATASSSATGSGSAAVAVRLVGSGVGKALGAVLGGVAVGAALL
ncbi:hypothetical protein HMN09_00153300 [Mycena chlorophos]|uniref:Yeast cell wall synthesis Kre9/Knh1-like N-terminal domain-containing protein n=1 Tax=Mycena chlorophos TaxID=658473 RepID=A0A8H6TQ03_MYCCL|nr:hypothetical protein HMN09_00153300 [Mycena chlorophos]